MNELTRRTVLGTLGAGAATLAGAGTAAAAGDDAKVRVAHASPDAPAVDVYVGVAPAGNDPTIAGLSFTDVTGYLEVPAGEYEVTITAAGSNDPVSPTPVTLALDPEDYTVAAIGELVGAVTGEPFRPDVFEDKLGVLRGDEGRVRVYHASPDAPAVDVAVVDDDGDRVLPLAEGIAFGEAGPNAEVPAGEYDVAVFRAGGTEPVFGPAAVEVRAGEVLTVFAEGFLTADPGFRPVLAYEEAAPFGRGRGRGGGRGP